MSMLLHLSPANPGSQSHLDPVLSSTHIPCFPHSRSIFPVPQAADAALKRASFAPAESMLALASAAFWYGAPDKTGPCVKRSLICVFLVHVAPTHILRRRQSVLRFDGYECLDHRQVEVVLLCQDIRVVQLRAVIAFVSWLTPALAHVATAVR